MKNAKKSSSSIKAIIFDAGGVLFENNWDQTKQEIMKKYGFSVFLYTDYPKEIGQKYGPQLATGKISFAEVIQKIAPLQNIPQFVEDYKTSYLNNLHINRQMIRLISKLKKNYKIFCLTNTNDIHLKANTDSGLFRIFDKVYASCTIGIKKPDKHAFELILTENYLSPSEVIFIDNSTTNITSAKSLGINSILFKNYHLLEKSLQKLFIQT